jgi:hypothetical protein
MHSESAACSPARSSILGPAPGPRGAAAAEDEEAEAGAEEEAEEESVMTLLRYVRAGVALPSAEAFDALVG